MIALHKYPRTHHIEGSRLQPGDEDLDSVSFELLKGRYLVIEEKLDGANAGVSFSPEGELLLQSRGHFLDGGPREKQFDLFKTWANSHKQKLRDTLGARYVLYGEWLYAKHTIFYDALPHYFLEFDVLDTQDEHFLSTARRRALLSGLPVVSVPVLWSGEARSLKEVRSLVGRSLFKGPRWQERLEEVCLARKQDPARVRSETDPSDSMEGLYIKVEEEGRVVGRYKYIRASFLSAVLDSGSHWLDRTILPNQLIDGADMFGETT
ncbi:MAG: RNA ligase family protein [Blastocatellia bacterium]|nr:RNA ligase family protein [Blastocatellia bacterium]